MWRNTHISSTQSTTLPAAVVGWEWDQIPTQPGYLAQEPAGVKQLTLTSTANAEDSWLQDAGRARSNTPPPGEPSNVSAVEYRAPSGALVFSSGTMEWAFGFDSEETSVIDQATYNVISEMGVQPATPASDITLDSPTEAKPPRPSFTASPSSTTINQPVTFDASASTDPDATITDYKWDLDNSGTFATDTGATPKLTPHLHARRAPTRCILKTTDSKGAVETTERTVNVANTVNAALGGVDEPRRRLARRTRSARPPRPTRAGRSPTTSGTSTATAPTRPTPAPHRPSKRASPPPARTPSGSQVSDNNGGKSTTTLSVHVDHTGRQPLLRRRHLGSGAAALLPPRRTQRARRSRTAPGNAERTALRSDSRRTRRGQRRPRQVRSASPARATPSRARRAPTGKSRWTSRAAPRSLSSSG